LSVWALKMVEDAAARRAWLKWLGVRAHNRALRAAKTLGHRISRKLRLRIEHLSGEGKTCYALGRVRRRGLAKVQRRMVLSAAATNLQRVAVSLPMHRWS
jgi:IS5 family transposase